MNQMQLCGREIGLKERLFLIAGPCVIESESHAIDLARAISAIAARCGVPYIFKASYDKANRTSLTSFRGPGLGDGVRVLGRVKDAVGVPILTDIHETDQVTPVAAVADILQIPAFLSSRYLKSLHFQHFCLQERLGTQKWVD